MQIPKLPPPPRRSPSHAAHRDPNDTTRSGNGTNHHGSLPYLRCGNAYGMFYASLVILIARPEKDNDFVARKEAINFLK